MRPEDNPAVRKELQAFADLIETTIRELENVGVPAQLAGAIDKVLPGWEKRDGDFAKVLRDLKGQGWQMQSAHLRAVRSKLVEHLGANLTQVKAKLK